MNALRELKKTFAQWLPVDQEFMYKRLGEMWCKQPPSPIADSCLGRICQNGTCKVCSMTTVCQNGTCKVCSMTTADKEASLEAFSAFRKENQCCAICSAVGTVAIPGLGVTEPHAVQLRGRLARTCQICRAQAAADGHSTPGMPGLCPGLGDEGCEYRNFTDGHNALCRQCQCSRTCPGLGDEDYCPQAAYATVRPRSAASAPCLVPEHGRA